MLNVVMQNVIMLNVIMLNVVMLNVVMLNVIMMSVVAPARVAYLGQEIVEIPLSGEDDGHLAQWLRVQGGPLWVVILDTEPPKIFNGCYFKKFYRFRAQNNKTFTPVIYEFLL